MPSEGDRERLAAVTRAREVWISKLIDLSRRNRLLYFRDLQTGTLDISASDPKAMEDFLLGETLALTRLLPRADDSTLSRAQEIRRTALSNLEERGLDTLFVAFGFATWAAADGGRSAESAILLAPVVLEKRGRDGRALALKLAGDFQINPILLHVLEREHGRRVSAESLLSSNGEPDEEVHLDPADVYARLERAVTGLSEFRVIRRAVLANFAFHKMAMVKDLRENLDELVKHDLIAAIAGDVAARESTGARREVVDPEELDRILPKNEFLVLDADSSQQAAIAAVVSLQDGVINGPPGTGKSQTIANLIAELAARGRRVLFVAEKRAALEVVIGRLRDKGLGHLTLDLHGAGITRRQVMKQFSESLREVHESAAPDADDIHGRFVDRRNRLNQHVARLHAVRLPSGLSVYQLQGRLLHFRPDEVSTVRWRDTELERINPATKEEVCDLLAELAGFSRLFLGSDPSPWKGAMLTDGQTVQRARDSVTRLATKYWASLRTSIAAVVAETGLPTPATLDDWKSVLALANGVNMTLEEFQAAVFQENLDSLKTALAPAQSRLSAALAWCFKRSYRLARKKVRSLCRNRKRSAEQLLRQVTMAAGQLKRWRALAPVERLPVVSVHAAECRYRLAEALTDINKLSAVLGRGDLTHFKLNDFERLIAGLASDTMTPDRLPRLLEIERRLVQIGAGAVVEEIRRQQPEPGIWPRLFEHAWLASCLDRARAEDPALGGFNGATHEQFVEQFGRLDRERLQVAIARVRRAHGERVISAMNAHPAQADLVGREAQKKARHIPLRKLLTEAPDVLTALRPCWLASPLSVSELMPVGSRYFDVVLFDEASQVLPEDAIPALLRASRAVVAGDQHQLPPTTFFATGEDTEEEDQAVSPAEGFESLLDQMVSFANTWPLEWHYRSLDEALIAFSNRHIYNDRLITFPGPGGPSSISHVLVPFVSGQDGQEESSSEEVRKLVDLVLRHATERPNETLGVIAMGIKHARRVEAALDYALTSRPDLDAFFDDSKKERFFVKNLERVQGDERDAIILTIGYGKDRSGRLLYRFGPLLTEGGERRLNVAVTRARRRMTLVSSFDHRDMDPTRSKARGVELLRLYLEYAASQGKRLGDPGQLPFPLNSFEADVYEALKAKGVPLLPQYGVSRYRIDFVAQHPKRPGRLVLAIECDGASYHSAYTARDRDRLRQEHLQALGWRFHRIWSTDWFMRRSREIERAISAFKAAVAHADGLDGMGGNPAVPVGREEHQGSSDRRLESANTPKVSGNRGPRPRITLQRSIEDYTQADLVALVQWIKSDGRLRTDEQIQEEVAKELGFQRRGVRIEAAIRAAIARSDGRRGG